MFSQPSISSYIRSPGKMIPQRGNYGGIKCIMREKVGVITPNCSAFKIRRKNSKKVWRNSNAVLVS